MENAEATFDAESFLDAVQTEAPSDKFVPVPQDDGSGYAARVKSGSVKITVIPFNKHPEKGVAIRMADGSTVVGGKQFEAEWIIDEPAVQEALGLTEPTVRDRFLLDLTPSGEIATGTNKNVKLGIRIKALGLNPNSYSFREFEGRSARVGVKHKPDARDPERVYPEVSRVTALS